MSVKTVFCLTINFTACPYNLIVYINMWKLCNIDIDTDIAKNYNK